MSRIVVVRYTTTPHTADHNAQLVSQVARRRKGQAATQRFPAGSMAEIVSGVSVSMPPTVDHWNG